MTKLSRNEPSAKAFIRLTGGGSNASPSARSPSEKSRLINRKIPKYSSPPRKIDNPRVLGYPIIALLLLNRSVNLVMYKALTTFSYYFAQDFNIPYTLFAIVAVMNFPATLVNVGVVPLYTRLRIDWVIFGFELLLAAACLLVQGWHTFGGLVFLRFTTGFAITAIRSEVNASVGAFTHGIRRTRSISLLEVSFGLSAALFLVVGASLQFFGWRGFFIGSASIITIMGILIFLFVPSWYLTENLRNVKIEISPRSGRTRTIELNNLTRLQMFSEVLSETSLVLVFAANIFNKICRNSFYYTFSKWLFIEYSLTPTMVGLCSLAMAAGHLLGTTASAILVPMIGVYGSCFLGALAQTISMFMFPISHWLGFSLPLTGGLSITFLYFFGCQLWYNNSLHISMSQTPRQILQPTVQTMFLSTGACGGMIGTLIAAHLWNLGAQNAIGLCGGICGTALMSIVASLWFLAYRRSANKTFLMSRLNSIDDDSFAPIQPPHISLATTDGSGDAGQTMSVGVPSTALEARYLTIEAGGMTALSDIGSGAGGGGDISDMVNETVAGMIDPNGSQLSDDSSRDTVTSISFADEKLNDTLV